MGKPATQGPVTIAHKGGVALVSIDNPPVNALSQAVRQGLLDAFRKLAADPEIAAIVVTGAGRDFIAGADLREMSLPPIEPSLPDVIAAMESCAQPIVAAVRGAALGGGYELALACDFRIADPEASVGLPETRLGIIPGAGGTQRLPRLVGIAKAIDLVGQARVLKAKDALALGLIDRIAAADLAGEAIRAAPTLRKRRLSEAKAPISESGAIEAAIASALKRAKGPAIGVAIDVVRQGAELPFQEALQRERAAFLRLRESDEAKALRHLFFAEREVRKIPGLAGVRPREIKHVAVIGAGTMGAGIAAAFADAGFPVKVIELDKAAAGAGADRLRGIYDRQVGGKRISTATAEERLGRIAVTDDWSFVRESDLVIEAVFEDMQAKTEVFCKIDELAPRGAVLATNTSYLDVDALAAVTRRPGDVLGLHFFSPANVMRLLEVVRGAQTSPEVLATGLDLARRIGKLPVVAAVCDGFIGNRIFAAYRRHAEYLALDGASYEAIDRAIENHGFAMGPFAVSDLAGLDIAWAMRQRRAATRDHNERYVEVADRLCEQGRLGRKVGRGWYLYPEGSARRHPDPEVEALFKAERAAKGIKARDISDDEIVRRLLAVMANEGAKVLAEGIALRPSDIDLVFVNGYGFPAIKGGPMFAADFRGLHEVLKEVEIAAGADGAGSKPAPLLTELAKRGSTFAVWAEGRNSSPET
jgi:3-hydroxyacyl-CoA dehydrogenase